MAAKNTVESYIEKHSDRSNELNKLRSILLSLPFEECIKWGMPTYTVDGKNIVGVGSFKNWSCLWFHQGSFLKDKSQVLENAQENKTKGMRQWRFSNEEEIDEDLVREYLKEAIHNQKEGKEITFAKKSQELDEIPDLLQDHLKSNAKHKKKFEDFTVSQRNNFSSYIKEAKREQTKLDRLERIKVLLENGDTLNTLWGG